MGSWLLSSVRKAVYCDSADSLFQSSRSSITTDTVFSTPPKQITSFAYEMHEPQGEPEVEVVFFHGFKFGDSGDAYWRDWTSADQSQCWPQTWLAEEFPGARVLSVTYDSSLVRTATSGREDMYLISENLSYSLFEKEVVGLSPTCPVVFVGHGVGGLVMKSICVHLHGHSLASQHEGQPMHLLKHLKGLFFYATPHLGSTFFSENMTDVLNSPLAKETVVHSVHAARLNEQFSQLRNLYGWSVYGVGEKLETDLGHGIRGTIVQEESARHGMGRSYSPIPADHFQICKPEDKNSIGFQLLARFIRNILEQRSTTSSGETLVAEAQPYPSFLDPITGETMIDPVKCYDGRTYDRWTVIHQDRHKDRTHGKTLALAFDDISVRGRLHDEYPEKEKQSQRRRQEYRTEALEQARLCTEHVRGMTASARESLVSDAVERLENVLKWSAKGRDKLCEDKLKRIRRRNRNLRHEDLVKTSDHKGIVILVMLLYLCGMWYFVS